VRKYIALLLALSVISIGTVPAVAATPVPSVVNVTSTSGDGTEAGTRSASVNLSWESKIGEGVRTYSVRATATGQTNGSGSTPVCANGTCNATVTGLVGGVVYSFVVTAIGSDANGTQASAAAVSFTAKSVSTAPTPLAPTTSRGAASLSWASPTNTGGLPLIGYTIEEAAGQITPIAINNPNESSYTVSGLTGGITYSFLIKARNALGSSASAAFATVNSASAPGIPESVSASATGTTVNVSWTEPNSNGSPITGYKIYLVNAANNLDVGQFTSALRSPASITNVGGGTYTVQVVATNAGGDSPRSVGTTEFVVQTQVSFNTPVITPAGLRNLDIGETVSIAASARSGAIPTISVESSPDGVCEFTDEGPGAGELEGVNPGTCTIIASTPPSGVFPAETITQNISVRRGQVITFAPIPEQSISASVTLSASASSGLTVRFAAAGSCLVEGAQLRLLASGGCIVTASQPGNFEFSPARIVPQSFDIRAGAGGFFVSPDSQANIPKASTVFAKVKGSAARSVILNKAKARTTIKLGQAVRATLTGLPRGARVSSILRTKAGASYFLSASRVKANGKYTTPAVKPKKKGVYRIVVTVGTEIKTLRVRVN
jgi:hypothetical protein